MGHGRGKKPERLFSKCYPSIIPSFVDQVQRGTKELRSIDPTSQFHYSAILRSKYRDTYAMHPDTKYDPSASIRENCEASPCWTSVPGGNGSLTVFDAPAPRSNLDDGIVVLRNGSGPVPSAMQFSKGDTENPMRYTLYKAFSPLTESCLHTCTSGSDNHIRFALVLSDLKNQWIKRDKCISSSTTAHGCLNRCSGSGRLFRASEEAHIRQHGLELKRVKPDGFPPIMQNIEIVAVYHDASQ